MKPYPRPPRSFANRTQAARGRRDHRGGVVQCIVEGLEPRRLLSATVATPLPNIAGAAGTTSAGIDLSGAFTDPSATIVQLTTTNGPIDIALTDTATPKTVANFLKYVKKGLYNGTVVHRAVPGFVIQGGGYVPTPTSPTIDLQHIKTFAPVVNEFDPSRSNVRGTIAMAKLGSSPNSATSEWFINVADNSSNLDNQNGGFTVFGHIINNTMTTADAIAALPTTGGAAGPTAKQGKQTFPLTNFPTQTPLAAGARPAVSDDVIVTSAAVVSDAPEFTYTATSDNPLVTPTISGDGVILTYGAGVGTANITVTASDPDGLTATQTFVAGVGELPVRLGAGGAKSVTFRGADTGVRGAVSFSGPGSANVIFTGTGLTQGGKVTKAVTITGTGIGLSGVTTTGTTGKSSLKFHVSGGAGTVDVVGITTDAAIGTIAGAGVNLTGPLTAAGVVGKLSLTSAAAGSTITLNGTPPARAATTIAAGSITGTTITSAVPLKSFSVKGNADALTLSLTDAAPGTLDLAKLTVGGTLSNSTITSAANLGAISAKAVVNTTVYAGVTPIGGAPLPTTAGEFTRQSSIASLKFGTVTGTDVATYTMGKASFGLVHLLNGGTPFGVAAHAIASLSGRTDAPSKFRLKKVSSPAALASQLAAQGLTLAGTDLVISII